MFCGHVLCCSVERKSCVKPLLRIFHKTEETHSVWIPLKFPSLDFHSSFLCVLLLWLSTSCHFARTLPFIDSEQMYLTSFFSID